MTFSELIIKEYWKTFIQLTFTIVQSPLCAENVSLRQVRERNLIMHRPRSRREKNRSHERLTLKTSALYFPYGYGDS